MKTLWKKGDILDHVAASTISSGDIVVIGGLVSSAINDIVSGATGPMLIRGAINVTKVAGSAWTEGESVYFNGTAFTDAAVGVHAGVAFAAAASDAVAGKVLLNARPGSLLDTTEIYVAKNGSDTYGDGSRGSPFLTITTALAAVTAARKTIMVGPGEYAEAGALVWPTTVSGIQLIGVGNRWETVISASAGDEVITLTPGVQTSTFELTIQNIQFDHDTSGQDGIAIDNTAMTKKCNVYLGQVGFAGDGADNAIVCTHGDTSNAIRIYWDGGNGDCESGIDLAQANDGDRFYVDNVVFGGDDLDLGTNIAGTVRMRYCEIAYRTFTGGGAASLVTLAWCISNNGGTLAAADAATVTTNSSATNPVIVGT